MARVLDMTDYVVVLGGDYHLHLRGVAAVDYILLRELERRRDRGGAELAERDQREPDLRALLQYQQHAVALPYPERTEQVRYPVRLLLHVSEREMLLFPGVVQPDERGLRRLEARVLVDDIISEVEVLRGGYSVVFPEILIAVKIRAGQVF